MMNTVGFVAVVAAIWNLKYSSDWNSDFLEPRLQSCIRFLQGGRAPGPSKYYLWDRVGIAQKVTPLSCPLVFSDEKLNGITVNSITWQQ
jgi:hypothetical protein